MMLIGHSIAQSVHLMHRSSSSRNIPRKRSEGSFFCSGYSIVTFFLTRWRPVTDRPSKRSSGRILSSHFFSATALTLHRMRGRRQAVPPHQGAPRLRQHEERREEPAEDPRQPHETGRAPREEQNGERDHQDVGQRQRNQPLPAQRHELVEAEPRKRRAEPDVTEGKTT